MNDQINEVLRKEGIFKWQIARKLKIHESTFSRMFRDELTEAQTQQIMSAVEEIKLERLKG